MLLSAIENFGLDQVMDAYTVGTHLGTKSVPNPGNANDEMFVQFLITEAVDSAADGASVEFQIVRADNAALTTNKVVLGSTGAIAEATLAAGFVKYVRIPFYREAPTKTYIGVQAVVTGEDVTDGTYSANLTKDPEYLQYTAL